MVKILQPSDIPQHPQHQGSLEQQLQTLISYANKFGLYDAADYLQICMHNAKVKAMRRQRERQALLVAEKKT